VIRTPRTVVLVVVPAVLALGGCADPDAAGGRSAGTDPAEPAAIAMWSEPVGVAPELVPVTAGDLPPGGDGALDPPGAGG
jgi:hypothetical protein